MNNTKFYSVGTDTLVIGLCLKLGTTTLTALLQDNLKYKKLFKKHLTLDENKITVVLIRDVIDKWKSGYRTEI